MIVDCLSDLHGFYPELEGGDLLILAGDLTASDTFSQFESLFEWMYKYPYKKYILIAGNHDNTLQNPIDENANLPVVLGCMADVRNTTYLCDSGTEFEGLKIWGSPWTTKFMGMNPKCMAFTVNSQSQLADKFENIPHDTDILITHSPAYGIFDVVYDMFHGTERHTGSHYLYCWFKYAHRPKLHVCGHIHEGYGQGEFFNGYQASMVKSVNASHVDKDCRPINKPIRIEL